MSWKTEADFPGFSAGAQSTLNVLQGGQSRCHPTTPNTPPPSVKQFLPPTSPAEIHFPRTINNATEPHMELPEPTLQIGKLTFPRRLIEASLRALTRIREEGPKSTSFGICTNLADHLAGDGVGVDTAYALVRALAPDWPEYSGDEGYPVPSYSEGKSPEQAYWQRLCRPRRNQWDRETEYGQARWRLLDFLIARLKWGRS